MPKRPSGSAYLQTQSSSGSSAARCRRPPETTGTRVSGCRHVSPTPTPKYRHERHRHRRHLRQRRDRQPGPPGRSRSTMCGPCLGSNPNGWSGSTGRRSGSSSRESTQRKSGPRGRRRSWSKCWTDCRGRGGHGYSEPPSDPTSRAIVPQEVV